MQIQPIAKRYARLSLLVLATLVLAVGCGRETQDDDRGAEVLYEEARAALDGRNYERAVQLYRNLTTRYPFGRHAEQAQLDMAYAMHRGGEPEQAISTLDRFIRTYPTHPNVDYAHYLKGVVHYDQAMGFLRRLFPDQVVDRDQTAARRSFLDFQELTQRHPESRYVADARQRMVFLRNVLAEYEMTVAEYYFRRGVYVAALNRANYVIENYPQAPSNAQALDLMTRAYEHLDLDQLALDTRRVFDQNYSSADLDDGKDGGFFSWLWPFD